MGTGYTRNDTANNIANGNVVNATDLDGEFDAIQASFDSATGHTHDGTAAEGGAIEVTGPSQEYLHKSTAIYPKTTNAYDIGTSALKFKDFFLSGLATMNNLTATGTINFTGATISNLGTVTTADIDGGTIDDVTLTTQDTKLIIEDNLDTTKKAMFNVSGITATTTRTFSFPDANTTLVGHDTTQTLTNKSIVFNAGAVGTPSISGTGDTDTGLYFPAADTLAAVTGGVERMRLDASGKFGIGTSAPVAPLDMGNSTEDKKLLVYSNNTSHSGFGLGGGLRMFRPNSTSVLFGTISEADGTAFVEQMRLDTSGNLLVGTTLSPDDLILATTAVSGVAIRNNGLIGITRDSQSLQLNRPTTTGDIAIWRQGGFLVGSISVTASATAYNTSSDERLKTNIAPTSHDSGAIIDATEIVEFDWRRDGSHQRFGVIAQDADRVYPEAITKGETDEDIWSADYSKYVPVLMKELQMLRARVAQLEST